MKKHIKLYTFLIFFFTSVSISYAQTPDTEDSVKQENSEQQSDNNALGHPGNLNGTNNSTGESGTVQGNTDNELLNTIINNNNAPAQEYVKGTRLPNEYSSGRTGGQFNIMQNPATAKPQGNINNNNNTQPDYGNGFTDDANKAPETKTEETK